MLKTRLQNLKEALNLIILLCFGVLIFSSCSDPFSPDTEHVLIKGREPERFALYRINIPVEWKVIFPDPAVSLVDSRLPLLECRINKKINITIHNFPAENIEQRIPPQAQIQRWKKQFKNCDETATIITPQSFSGYTGFLLETRGEIDRTQTAIMGWAMQIGRDHYRNLSYTDQPNQMRADVTIKATGDPETLSRHRSQLFRFARSFELIEEIPVPR